MSLAIEGAGAWRARIDRADPIRAADPLGSGASLSPWQALMASSALAQNFEAGGWQARIETGPAAPRLPVVDDPERIETAAALPPKPATPNPAASNSGPPGLFEDGDFSLADLLDVINPLQHIPLVSSIYRELTGDRIGHGARLAGGMLFLGPLGGLSALANIVMLEASGKDIGDHALALFKDDPAAATAVAANTNATAGEGMGAGAKSAPGGESRQNDNISDETALAELLPPGALAPNIQDPAADSAPVLASWRHAPPGAIPLPGRSVDFTQAALRPTAIAPAPATTPKPSAAADDDLPPPPPPPGPIAGPGWKGFYSPPEIPAEIARGDSLDRPPTGGTARAGESPRALNDAPLSGRRAQAPDPMAALAAKRTPGAMAGTLSAPRPAPVGEPQAAPPGAIASEGGWFTDTMLSALGKYEDARRLRGPQAPEAARRDAVNVVN
ncbi:MAG: hypothetical protein AAB223_08575 [Pseudomonadota bacterium]